MVSHIGHMRHVYVRDSTKNFPGQNPRLPQAKPGPFIVLLPWTWSESALFQNLVLVQLLGAQSWTQSALTSRRPRNTAHHSRAFPEDQDEDGKGKKTKTERNYRKMRTDWGNANLVHPGQAWLASALGMSGVTYRVRDYDWEIGENGKSGQSAKII